MINKNSRNSIDQRNKARSQKANINIQINFNMKDKLQGFSGKKIDNYVEIQQKSTIRAETHLKQTDQSKKPKKKNLETIDRSEKEKMFETPNKQKLMDGNRASKYNKAQKTPQRKSVEKKMERSKSTNQKLVKRKNGKSVENIRAIKPIKRQISPALSADKSRSHSKSSKKIIKSSQTSTKNLNVFSNSGIKNQLRKSREKIPSKRPSQQDHDKIKKFMQEKKKKEKSEKVKQLRQEKAKKQKLTTQLKKVEAERKANASKPYPLNKKLIEERQQRLPIYFEDEDFEDSQYDNLKRQAEKLVHQSPTPKQTIETIPISKIKGFENSSGKKTHKRHGHASLVNKYLNGTITDKQYHQLQKNILKIQCVWRGYTVRKLLAKRLNEQSTKNRYIKNRMQNKKGAFWNDEQNSIINLQRDSNIKIEQQYGSSEIIYYNSNANSNANSNISQNSLNSKLASSKGDRYKKLSIQLEQSDIDKIGGNEKSKLQNEEAAKMAREIEELRRMIEQQNEKYRSLQEQNINLKNNIKVLNKKQVKEDLITSNDFIEIRMPKKIESPKPDIDDSKKTEIKNLQVKKQINLFIQAEEQSEKAVIDLNSFKKQFQAFECSSPSNAMLEQQLKSLKNKNMEGIFLKKQIQMKQRYEKRYQMFDKMLSDRLFSPRTYNMKKKELQSNMEKEILEIKSRKDEAKRVVGFIADLSQDESVVQNQQSLRATSIGIKNQNAFNFKKGKEKETQPAKVLKDNFTNTTPKELKQADFKPVIKQKQHHHAQHESNSSYSSQQEKQYKKYWTDDVEEVHSYAMNYVKKIEEAMKAEKSDQSSQYNSVGHQKEQSLGDTKKHGYSRSGDCNINLQTLKQSYEDYLQQEIPSQNQRKAKEIFNKIDLSECKSQQDLENSHENICKLLNTDVFNSTATGEVKQLDNLYISQAQFNKKRKQDELSRSSSFQKSNKSMSANNSQLQMKGFNTNLTFIKEFCISVCEYIRNNELFKETFVENISQTTKYDFNQYLKSYRVTLGGQIKNNFNTYTDQYLYHYFKLVSSKDQAISHQLFSHFMKVYQEEKIATNQWTKACQKKDVKQLREYFLISIIDAFNQSLEFQKPGGAHGEPFPWMSNSNRLKNHAHFKLRYHKLKHSEDSQEETEEDKELDQIFGSSIAKIIQWGSFLCGFIADPSAQMGDSQIANLSEEQLSSIRQNRIGLMLEKWLLEEEEKITNSGSEYTEVLLNLNEKIVEMLVLEFCEEFEEL